MLLTHFGDESLAEPLLALFADPQKGVRAVVIRELPIEKWSAATQERVRLAALDRLRDRATEVRCAAAYVLVSVGKREDVETLRNGLKDIKGHSPRTAYGDYLDLLTKRFRVKG